MIFTPARSTVSCLLLLASSAPNGCNFFQPVQQQPPQTKLLIRLQQNSYVNGVLVASIPRDGSQLTGSWLFDKSSSTSAGSVYSFPLTTIEGLLTITNARIGAEWEVNWTLIPPCYDNIHYNPPVSITDYYSTYDVENIGNRGTILENCNEYDDVVPASPAFAYADSLPAYLTVPSNDAPLTQTGGPPVLSVYGSNPNSSSDPLISITATETTRNGSSSTYQYPALPAGLYGYAVADQHSNGTDSMAGHGMFAIGSRDTSYPSAFGIDALNVLQTYYVCTTTDPYGDGTYAGPTTCDSGTYEDHYPIVTLYNSAAVKFGNQTISVGTHPTVVRAYNYQDIDNYYGPNPGYQSDYNTSEYLNALVVNTGANSVSIIDLSAGNVSATIAVGTQPVDAQISPDGSSAYVLNHGDGTLSTIDLVNQVNAGAHYVGVQPTSLTLDGNGNAIVGGDGYVENVNLSTYAVSSVQQTNGTVSGIAYSRATGNVVTSESGSSNSASTSVVYNRSGGPSARMSQVQSLSAPTAYAQYQASALSPTLLWPMQSGGSASVDVSTGGSLGAAISGSQFAITDMATGYVLYSGVAEGVLRGIADDPGNSFVYFTVPDSNEVITVPVPQMP